MKNATFDTSKKILGPVHLHPKTDKWDYLRSPIMKKKIVSCFDIGEVPRSPGEWNWNWLYFLPFIFTFEQCVPPPRIFKSSDGPAFMQGRQKNFLHAWKRYQVPTKSLEFVT